MMNFPVDRVQSHLLKSSDKITLVDLIKVRLRSSPIPAFSTSLGPSPVLLVRALSGPLDGNSRTGRKHIKTRLAVAMCLRKRGSQQDSYDLVVCSSASQRPRNHHTPESFTI